MPVTMTSRQKEILDATLTVIDRDGMKKFTMKNVAQEIGVTDAALYKHFPDKAAILGALANLFSTPGWAGAVAPVPAPGQLIAAIGCFGG